jgi:maltokinase
MTALDELRGTLHEWLPRQRWFAGKGRPITSYDIESDTVLRDEDPALHIAILRVNYEDGEPERYQLIVGLRSDLPQRLEYAVIGHVDSRAAYDAVHDPELMGELLRRISEDRGDGAVGFAHMTGAKLDTTLTSRLLTGEQSNSSVVYADTYILKVFRKLAAGLNPDLEVTRALAAVGCPYIAAPLGWIETELEGQPATLGLLQNFYFTATDGWALATTSVRDLFAEADLHADEVGGDFAAEAERLGHATAQVHLDLARALPTATADSAQLKELAQRMHDRLDHAIGAVPELGAHARQLRAAYDAVAERRQALTVQRIHGDLHLGQVLRTEAGWLLLDFEGEPARPLAERTALDTPMRDVAGMLRSFDYAAKYLLAEQPGQRYLAYRADEWAERNRGAFCAGYIAGGGVDPREEAVLLRAYELDKAVYEVVYEARHRPTWIGIPLGSIERLASS